MLRNVRTTEDSSGDRKQEMLIHCGSFDLRGDFFEKSRVSFPVSLLRTDCSQERVSNEKDIDSICVSLVAACQLADELRVCMTRRAKSIQHFHPPVANRTGSGSPSPQYLFDALDDLGRLNLVRASFSAHDTYCPQDMAARAITLAR